MEENLLQIITCPNCGEKIQINEILSKNIESKIREELGKKYYAAINNEKRKIKEEYELDSKSKEEKLKKEIAERDEIIKEIKNREELLKRQEDEISEKFKNIDNEVNQRLFSEKQKMEQKIKTDNDLVLKDLQNQILEKDQKVANLTKNELDLRREKRELEEKAKNIDLEIERKVEEKKNVMIQEMTKNIEEKHSLKSREYEELIGRYKRQVEELNLKLEQGSQQLQGEVQELELEELLKNSFPTDNIKPVAKGKTGADIIQEIINQYGQKCGSIIWESKRTKNWSDGWLTKLKDDQRTAKSDIAIIVSQALPDNINNIGQIDGVWISNFKSSQGLAIALRENLIQINIIKNSQVGKNLKMESIYSYLCSNEFKQRIDAIVEAFSNMKIDLDKEKQYFEKIWAKREKQIETVTKNTSGMYGDLQALIGSALPEVKQLEIESDELSLQLNE
jgi:hypothetical protein